MQNTRYTKRIRIFTSVYAAVAVFAVAMLIYTIITIQRINSSIVPEYHYYGSDTVSGWATIFSGLGYMGGWMGKAFLMLYIMVCGAETVYWTAGAVLSLILRKRVLAGHPSVNLGIAVGVWTIIPGVQSLVSLAAALAKRTMNVCSAGILFAMSAVFIGGGIFLLTAINRGEWKYGGQ